MSRVDISNEELSAEVAGRLFGKAECDICAGIPGKEHIVGMMDYASDYNAAMGLVVPEMRWRDWRFHIRDVDYEVRAVFLMDKKDVLGIGKAPLGEEPRAICLAALAALDSQEGKE